MESSMVSQNLIFCRPWKKVDYIKHSTIILGSMINLKFHITPRVTPIMIRSYFAMTQCCGIINQHTYIWISVEAKIYIQLPNRKE